MARAAVLALARVELRRSWRTLLLLGVLAGVTAAVALAGLGVAERTTSAHDRLLAATALDDARVLLMGRPEAAPAVAALPGVRAAWPATSTVGQVRGGDLQYVAVTSGPPKPPGLFTPVVVAGREPAPDAPREVVVSEKLAGFLDLRPGSTLPLQLLLPEEVLQFDTGFGAPDGPAVDLEVTGVVRIASSGSEGTGPVYGGPAFAREFAPYAASLTQLLRLDPGPQARDRFEAGLAALSADAPPSPAAAEFGPLRALYPSGRTDPQVATAERVLGTALRVLALLAAAAGVLAAAQGFSRLAAAGAPAQRTESAVGLVTVERVAARVLPALLPAALAGALAAGGALLAGHVEPLGQLAAFEPSPGWRPDLVVAGAGAAATVVLVLALAAGTTWAAGRARDVAREPAVLALPRALAWPVLLVGTRFALLPGRRGGAGGSAVPVRTTLVGVVLGVTGLVATGTFAASLAGVRDAPSAYGWTADFSVVDAKEHDVARLLADPAVADVDLVSETTAPVGTRTVTAYGVERRKGALPWTLVAGRLPRAGAEVAVGPRLAEDLGVAVGDRVPVGTAGEPATVVGVVQAPALAGERLGTSVVLSPELLTRDAESQPWVSALVRARAESAAVYDRYAATLELTPATAPPEVGNLADLGRLPAALQALLALVAAVALGHALVLTTRRRTRDLGVLRALGFTPRQVGATVVAMAGTTAAVGIAVGVPLGLGIGRLAWEETAAGLGLAGDVHVPVVLLLALAPAAVLGALAVAALPARRAARLSPAVVLRAE